MEEESCQLERFIRLKSSNVLPNLHIATRYRDERRLFDSNDESHFLHACIHGDAEMAKYLLEYKDINPIEVLRMADDSSSSHSPPDLEVMKHRFKSSPMTVSGSLSSIKDLKESKDQGTPRKNLVVASRNFLHSSTSVSPDSTSMFKVMHTRQGSITGIKRHPSDRGTLIFPSSSSSQVASSPTTVSPSPTSPTHFSPLTVEVKKKDSFVSAREVSLSKGSQSGMSPPQSYDDTLTDKLRFPSQCVVFSFLRNFFFAM